jgi:hypothetical protein
VSELRTRLEPLSAPRQRPDAGRAPWRLVPLAGSRGGRAEPDAESEPEPERTKPALSALGAYGVVVGLALIWAAGFGWLAVQRHLAGGSHAEDLGFTDQVLANFLRGQFFRMSIYQGATWNTELDVASLARPDSLLAFHF